MNRLPLMVPRAHAASLAGMLLILLGSHRLAAQEVPPLFIVDTIDGPQPAAALERLSDTGALHLGGDTPRVFGPTEWVALRRAHGVLPPFPTTNFVMLTSGERIPLEPRAAFRLEEEQLFFHPASGPEISVALAFLSYLCVEAAAGEDDPELFLAGLEKTNRPRDVLYLKNGDRIEGSLMPSTRARVTTMNLGDRTVETPSEQIALLAMNTELQARPRTKKPYAHIVTAGGARWQLRTWRLDVPRGILAGNTLFGAKVEVPLAQLISLVLRHGQAVFLSDLTPVNTVLSPFLGARWSFARDAAATGRQIVLDKNYYDKGLGMHAQTRATYDLNGNFRWFAALVGLDERSGQRGHVKVSVLLDGKSVLARQELAGRTPPLPLRLDVRNARSLTLVVDFSDFGDVQGHVNWADARLIRSAK